MKQRHPRSSRYVRWWWTALLSTVMLSGLREIRAETMPPAFSPVYEAGLRALDQGLPQVAAFKLREFLQTNPAPALRHAATLALVRALLVEQDAPAALTTLDGAYPLPPTAAETADPTLAFWRAQTLAALGRWMEALDFYTSASRLPENDPTLVAQARFGRGEALLALSADGDFGLRNEAAMVFKALCDHPLLGAYARLRYAEIALDSHHLKEAARVLGDLTPDGQSTAEATNRVLLKEHTYLVGRLRLAQRQPALAQQIFTGALPPPDERRQGLTARLLVDNYWGWARSCLDEDQPDRAQAALENLLEHEPPTEFLAPSFAWLESLCDRLPNPDLTDLQRWAADDERLDREAYARLTLAHLEGRAGRAERAEEILAAFGADFPSHPLRARALLDLAALRLSLGRTREARAALNRARRLAGSNEQWRTEIETLDARTSLAENDNVQAAERFGALAVRLGTGIAAEGAAFNAVLASLRSGDAGRYAAARSAFNERFPQSTLAAEFPLEEGLDRAEKLSAANPAAGQSAADNLRLFLSDHPAHPRAAEARIALAELAFQQDPSDATAALSELDAPDLRRVSNDVPAPMNPTERDRADYLAIWLADAPGPAHDADKAVGLAKKFLDDHPDSPLVAETRLKLGEIYFARSDYPDAQTQLELLDKNSPNSPLADAALYLAGCAATSSQSTAGTDKAVDHFSRLAQRQGSFRLPAQLRLAELMLDKPETAKDALVLYDSVLAATNGPGPLNAPDLDARCTALCGKGQTLLVLAAKDPTRYREAAATFDQLATGTPGASLRWRRQAFTLKGNTLKETGDADAALAAYDDALNAAPDPGTGPEATAPEWTWFYKAGRNAANLLEAQKQWAAAIAVYKKLASPDGPMKSEFETRLARSRLEHFIWPD